MLVDNEVSKEIEEINAMAIERGLEGITEKPGTGETLKPDYKDEEPDDENGLPLNTWKFAGCFPDWNLHPPIKDEE